MNKEANINVRVDQESKERFLAICQKEHRSQSEQIIYWIENYKEKEGSD